MSEFTKHSLTSIGTNKKEKQDKKVKRTVRFELPLLESNEQAYSQFNYKDLLISREKRDRQKSKERGESLQNGFGEVASAEDAEMVRRLEEKYGNAEVGGKKKKTKRGRFENFADLGAGYDETDPFIDNTDAYDEVVPEQMTTAHGGFYINCGPLEFKQMSDQSDAEEPVKVKRRTKRVMSIIDEDEDEDKSDSNATKKIKDVEENADVTKKRKLSQDLQLLKKKKKHAIDELTKKKSATVKELLKEKRDTLDLSLSGVAPPEVKKQPLGGDSVLARTSITDAIESVVNGAVEDDASQESTASQGSKSTAISLQSSDSEASQDQEEKEKNMVKEETLLPDNLPEKLKDLINGLRKAGKTSAEGKCKFFTMDVNNMLLGVEKICYTLTSNSRNSVYKHLESYLPCTKDTLMKRAKKLNIKSGEDRIKKLLAKLKVDVDAVMPAVLENYGKESQRVVQEKSVEELPSDSEDKSGSKSRIPRKIFPWTKELQSLVVEVIDIKTRCLDLSKTRKESVEINLSAFLDKEVKTLWPAGWMSVPKLLKQKNKKSNTMRKPSKQVSFAAKVPDIPPVSVPLTLDALVTAAPVTAVPLSSSAASVSWSNSSTTITPINSFPSSTTNTNGILSQATAVYTQSSGMSPNSVLSQASTAYTQSATTSPSVSTSTFSSVKCSPPLDKPSTNHSKLDTSADHKFSSKISDIPNSISRTTTVIVPNSPSKNTSPEIATVVTSSSVLETSSHMSLANIPDSISVMAAVTPPQTTSANNSPPKPMSLKHRILHDAAIDLTNCTKPNLLSESAVGVLEVGLPVNKVNDNVNMFETVSESQVNDIATKLKPPRRKRKEAKEFIPEPRLEPEVEPAPQPRVCEKENERRLSEETNAATSFISQIINESLQSYPNASTIRSNSVCHNPPSPNRSPPREVPQENKFGSAFQSDFGQSKATHKKKNMERRPSAADSDMSVQMEVNRVLEELKELQGLSVGKTDSVEDYSSKSSHNSLPHTNSLGMPVPKLNVENLLKCNPITNKRSSVGIGFQDEFQKHISQIKQDKVASVPSVASYPQVNQASVGLHSTIRHASGADGSQSRNSNGSDMTSSYLKQSVTSDPFAGLLFGGVQARNVLNSHFQEKSYDQSGLGGLPGMPTFNPNTDDPFTMSPYGMKTDAGKNQHSSPC